MLCYTHYYFFTIRAFQNLLENFENFKFVLETSFWYVDRFEAGIYGDGGAVVNTIGDWIYAYENTTRISLVEKHRFATVYVPIPYLCTVPVYLSFSLDFQFHLKFNGRITWEHEMSLKFDRPVLSYRYDSSGGVNPIRNEFNDRKVKFKLSPPKITAKASLVADMDLIFSVIVSPYDFFHIDFSLIPYSGLYATLNDNKVELELSYGAKINATVDTERKFLGYDVRSLFNLPFGPKTLCGVEKRVVDCLFDNCVDQNTMYAKTTSDPFEFCQGSQEDQFDSVFNNCYIPLYYPDYSYNYLDFGKMTNPISLGSEELVIYSTTKTEDKEYLVSFKCIDQEKQGQCRLDIGRYSYSMGYESFLDNPILLYDGEIIEYVVTPSKDYWLTAHVSSSVDFPEFQLGWGSAFMKGEENIDQQYTGEPSHRVSYAVFYDQLYFRDTFVISVRHTEGDYCRSRMLIKAKVFDLYHNYVCGHKEYLSRLSHEVEKEYVVPISSLQGCAGKDLSIDTHVVDLWIRIYSDDDSICSTTTFEYNVTGVELMTMEKHYALLDHNIQRSFFFRRVEGAALYDVLVLAKESTTSFPYEFYLGDDALTRNLLRDGIYPASAVNFPYFCELSDDEKGFGLHIDAPMDELSDLRITPVIALISGKTYHLSITEETGGISEYWYSIENTRRDFSKASLRFQINISDCVVSLQYRVELQRKDYYWSILDSGTIYPSSITQSIEVSSLEEYSLVLFTIGQTDHGDECIGEFSFFASYSWSDSLYSLPTLQILPQETVFVSPDLYADQRYSFGLVQEGSLYVLSRYNSDNPESFSVANNKIEDIVCVSPPCNSYVGIGANSYSSFLGIFNGGNEEVDVALHLESLPSCDINVDFVDLSDSEFNFISVKHGDLNVSLDISHCDVSQTFSMSILTDTTLLEDFLEKMFSGGTWWIELKLCFFAELNRLIVDRDFKGIRRERFIQTDNEIILRFPHCESMAFEKGRTETISIDTQSTLLGSNVHVEKLLTSRDHRSKLVGNDYVIKTSSECPNLCSGNGDCDFSTGVCSCYEDWYGDNCGFPMCNGLTTDGCVHGECQNNHVCLCEIQWYGPKCDSPKCNGLEDGCQNGGSCNMDHICVCLLNWSGLACEKPLCNGMSEGCLNGECLNDHTCQCNTDWFGDMCENPKCNGLEVGCLNDGSCSSEHKCFCTNEWFGDSCEKPICNGKRDGCLNGGKCSDEHVCICADLFVGNDCSEPICNEREQGCIHGKCSLDHTCQCFGNWSGTDCSIDGNVTPDPDVPPKKRTMVVIVISVVSAAVLLVCAFVLCFLFGIMTIIVIRCKKRSESSESYVKMDTIVEEESI